MRRFNLESPIFNETKAREIISSALTRVAKRFKQVTKDNQTLGPHTGKLYQSRNKGQGSGFRRYHRASSRGQRPSPDTMNLLNATDDRKDSWDSHTVYVDDAKAPYGKYLQEGLDRPIMSPEDAAEFEGTVVKEEMERLGQELTR